MECKKKKTLEIQIRKACRDFYFPNRACSYTRTYNIIYFSDDGGRKRAFQIHLQRGAYNIPSTLGWPRVRETEYITIIIY